MTELTQEQLAEIRERTRAAYRRIHWSIQAPPSVTDREALLHHIDHQAARIAELEQRLEKVRAVETYYSDERFDACDCPCCDGRLEVRDKLTTILEGDSA